MLKRRKKKLNELTLEELRKIEPKLKEDVLKVFDLNNSINSKKSYGGTSFDNIKKIILALLFCCILISCGKKGDPKYKDPEKEVKMNIFMVKKA